MSDKTPAPGGESTQKSRLAIDLAALVALAPIAAAGLRVWIYCGGDLAVFQVVLQTLNIPVVLVSTAFQILPYIVLMFVFYGLTEWRFRDWLSAMMDNNRWLSVAVPTAVLLTVISVPTRTVLITILIFGTAFAVYRILYSKVAWSRRHLNFLIPRRGDRSGPDGTATSILLAIVILASPATMWLPLERVDVKNDRSTVGYVLESTEVWTTILSEERDIIVKSTAEVDARTVCREDREFRMIDFYRAADYDLVDVPGCPDLS